MKYFFKKKKKKKGKKGEFYYSWQKNSLIKTKNILDQRNKKGRKKNLCYAQRKQVKREFSSILFYDE